MKIAYFINSLHTAGGVERVLSNKLNYFSQNKDIEIFVITTDQNKREAYYKLPENVKHVDLGINYFKDFHKGIFYRIVSDIKNKKNHKIMIQKFLTENSIDVCIGTGYEDKNILCGLLDNSKKVREVHHCKEFKKIRVKVENRSWFYKLKAYIDIVYEEYKSKKYDKLILLTHEDKVKWSNKNIDVIHNSTSFLSKESAKLETKKAIAVGRLTAQKGFDDLIKSWKLVSKKFPEWKLEIYGEGEQRKYLQNLIDELNLKNVVALMGATKEIQQKYLDSSLYVMSSRYEGLPMVLVEAMSYGLPLVSFSCPSGPSEIIQDGYNGYLAKNGDVKDLADKIIKTIEDEEHLKYLGANSKKSVEKFSEETIMKQWENLFNDLLDK